MDRYDLFPHIIILMGLLGIAATVVAMHLSILLDRERSENERLRHDRDEVTSGL
jgi:hypothetical protein